ncbi:hypothetical protein O181_123030, partial [Austropuccinia psidii MF-1]|nr:hypothetical protein [Austropuccinia psidii MF-1]
MELDSEVELIPQKGKERAISPVEQNPHKESALSQRQVPEMPMIPKPELEL